MPDLNVLDQIKVDGVATAQLQLHVHDRVGLCWILSSEQAVKCDASSPDVSAFVSIDWFKVHASSQIVFEKFWWHKPHILVLEWLARNCRL